MNKLGRNIKRYFWGELLSGFGRNFQTKLWKEFTNAHYPKLCNMRDEIWGSLRWKNR